MNLLRMLRVAGQVARHAIVEAHAQRDQQICILDRLVHPRLAMHAHHA